MTTLTRYDDPFTDDASFSVDGWAEVRVDWRHVEREAARRAPILAVRPSMLEPIRRRIILDLIAPFIWLGMPCHDPAASRHSREADAVDASARKEPRP